MPRTTRHPPGIGSGSEQRARSSLVTYRLKPDEFARLQRAGEERGLSAAQYARAAALSSTGQAIPKVRRPRPIAAPPELQAALPILTEALTDIRHIRALLNQLAARGNAGAVAAAMAGYAKAEAAVKDLADRVIAAVLGKRTAP
ncbi:plasmid mobilization protein [Azospirillum sp.]|uniref:plasmid mobilization protein n=1 Tax=Azospirillum sp. TaxID=34012 RepID=UPI003D7227AC